MDYQDDAPVGLFTYRRYALRFSVESMNDDTMVGRLPTFASLLWSLWLKMPSKLRGLVYRKSAYWSSRTSSPSVKRLPFGLIMKTRSIRVVEALSTQYVGTHTSIPVPTILDVIQHPSFGGTGVCVLMTALPGRSMLQFAREGVDLRTVSAEQVSTLSDTLREWLCQLRALSPPSDGLICSLENTSLVSHRLSYSRSVGPFPTAQAFHKQNCLRVRGNDSAEAHALDNKRQQKQYRLCFTHGDLMPANIILDDEYRPVGLVDWECAGWLPEYWELISSVAQAPRYAEWCDLLRNILPMYDDELALDQMLYKYSNF